MCVRLGGWRDGSGSGSTYGVGDHGGEHRSVRVVRIELPYEYGDHCELDNEDDGMEEGLLVFQRSN